jgi:hypothetical protein
MKGGSLLGAGLAFHDAAADGYKITDPEIADKHPKLTGFSEAMLDTGRSAAKFVDFVPSTLGLEGSNGRGFFESKYDDALRHMAKTQGVDLTNKGSMPKLPEHNSVGAQMEANRFKNEDRVVQNQEAHKRQLASNDWNREAGLRGALAMIAMSQVGGNQQAGGALDALMRLDKDKMEIKERSDQRKEAARAAALKEGKENFEKAMGDYGLQGQQAVEFRNFMNFNYPEFITYSWTDQQKNLPRMLDTFHVSQARDAKGIGKNQNTLKAFEPAQVREMTMADVTPGQIGNVKTGLGQIFHDDENPNSLSYTELMKRQLPSFLGLGSPDIVVGKDGTLMRKQDYLGEEGALGYQDRLEVLKNLKGGQ